MLVDQSQMMVQMPQKEMTPAHAKIEEEIYRGISLAVQELEKEAMSMQQRAVNETYQSEEFTTIFDNMKGAIDKEAGEIEDQFAGLMKQMELLEKNLAKKCNGVVHEKK